MVTLRLRPSSSMVPGHEQTAGLQCVGDVLGGDPGAGELVLVRGDLDPLVGDSGQVGRADARDRLQLGDEDVLDRGGHPLLIAVLGAGGQQHHRHHVRAHGHDGGADVVGEHPGDLVDGDLGLADQGVLVAAVVELRHDLRRAGTAGGGDRVDALHTLECLLDGFGDLSLDHLRGRAVVLAGDHHHREGHLGEELALGRHRGEHAEEQRGEKDEPEAGDDGGVADGTAVEGANEIPYDVPNQLVDWHMAPGGVPTLWWRSVGHSHAAFAVAGDGAREILGFGKTAPAILGAGEEDVAAVRAAGEDDLLPQHVEGVRFLGSHDHPRQPGEGPGAARDVDGRRESRRAVAVVALEEHVLRRLIDPDHRRQPVIAEGHRGIVDVAEVRLVHAPWAHVALAAGHRQRIVPDEAIAGLRR